MDISKIKLNNNDIYTIKDSAARMYLESKYDKLSEATENNIVVFGAAGRLLDSNNSIDTFATNAGLQTEISTRSLADNNLQTQIDAITSQSDVVDVVGTYAELVNYSKFIYVDDIVKVLVDESRNDAIAYYRCYNSTTPGSYGWTYIGSQGPFYTKAETDILTTIPYRCTATMSGSTLVLAPTQNITLKDGDIITFISPTAGLYIANVSLNNQTYDIVDGRDRSVLSQTGFIGESSRVSCLVGTSESKLWLCNIANMHVGVSVQSEFELPENATMNDAFDAVYQAFMQWGSKMVTSISASSTHEQIPTAKAVYDLFNSIPFYEGEIS